jgi:hypothetical protein
LFNHHPDLVFTGYSDHNYIIIHRKPDKQLDIIEFLVTLEKMQKINITSIYNKYLKWLLLLFLLVFIAACAANANGEDFVPTETAAPVEETSAPTPTEIEPDLRVLIAVGSNAEAGIISRVIDAVEVFAAADGLDMVVEDGLSSEMITPETRIVVGIGADLDISSIAADTPQVSFLALEHQGVTPGANLFVIGDPAEDWQRQVFMAGYLTALVSSDNKMGALIPADSENPEQIVELFNNGARFYCGICRPQFPPYGNFPRWEILSLSNGETGFQPVVDDFIVSGIDIIYVHGALASPSLLSYLAERDIKVVSNSGPDARGANWVGTLIVDPAPALDVIWTDLLTGQDGYQLPASVTVVNRNTSLFSDARYRLFDSVLSDLEQGLIGLTDSP